MPNMTALMGSFQFASLLHSLHLWVHARGTFKCQMWCCLSRLKPQPLCGWAPSLLILTGWVLPTLVAEAGAKDPCLAPMLPYCSHQIAMLLSYRKACSLGARNMGFIIPNKEYILTLNWMKTCLLCFSSYLTYGWFFPYYCPNYPTSLLWWSWHLALALAFRAHSSHYQRAVHGHIRDSTCFLCSAEFPHIGK